jgi:hypothetical protein
MREPALSRVMLQKACHWYTYSDGAVRVPPRKT